MYILINRKSYLTTISYLSVMETEEVQVPAKKKEPSKRTAAQKKSLTIESSDDEDEIVVLDDDEGFEIEEMAAPEPAKKGGRKAAGNTKTAAKAPAATKKRGPAKKPQQQVVGQKLLTEMLNPATENSPEKKVRKMRASPFNKKSSSMLGKVNQDEEISSSSPSTSEEVSEVVAAKARPQRANRRQARYVQSDSESDKATADSDFNEDED